MEPGATGEFILPAHIQVVKLEQSGKLPPFRGALPPDLGNVAGPALPYREQLAGAVPVKKVPDVFVEPGSETIPVPGEVLGNLVDDVDAEAVGSQIHPEIHHFLHFPDHGGVFPVQVRLAHGVGVEVILPPDRVELPG